MHHAGKDHVSFYNMIFTKMSVYSSGKFTEKCSGAAFTLPINDPNYIQQGVKIISKG